MTTTDHKNIIEKVYENHIKDYDIQPESSAEEFAIKNDFTDNESFKITQGLFDAIADDYVDDSERATLKDMGLDMQAFDSKDWQFSWTRKYALSDNTFQLESPADYQRTAQVLASLKQTDVGNLGELERTILGLQLKSKVYPLFKDFIPADYSKNSKGLAEYFVSGAYKKILIPVVQSSLDEKARHLALRLISQEGDADTVKTLIKLNDSFVIETANLAQEITTELISENLAIAKELLSAPSTDRTLAINLYLMLGEIDSPKAIHIVIKTAPRYKADQEIIATANAALIAKGVVPFPKIRFMLQNETDFVFTDYLLSQADALKDEIAAATSADLRFGSSTQATPLHIAYLKTHIDDLAAEPDHAPTQVHEQIDGYLNTPYKDFALALRAYATEQGLYATEPDVAKSLTTNREFREHQAKPLYENALKLNPHQIFAGNAYLRIQDSDGIENSMPSRISTIEPTKVTQEQKNGTDIDPLELREGGSITKPEIEIMLASELKEVIAGRKEGTYYAIRILLDRYNSLMDLDLSGLKLNKVTDHYDHVGFQNCNLRNADLSNLNLDGSDFSGADLTGANLSGSMSVYDPKSISDFVPIKFNSAKLDQANFSECIFWRPEFSRASARGTDFSKSHMNFANFLAADLEEANFSQSVFIRSFFNYANLTKADLSGAKLSKARLAEVNLTGADLSSSIFDGAELQGAVLKDNILDGASFKNAERE